MKFIVKPQPENAQHKNGPCGMDFIIIPPTCPLDMAYTQCVLCSEDPRWCI